MLTAVIGMILIIVVICGHWPASVTNVQLDGINDSVHDSVPSPTHQTAWTPDQNIEIAVVFPQQPPQQPVDPLRSKIMDFAAALQADIDRSGDAHLSEKQKEDLQKFVAGLDAVDLPEATKTMQAIFSSNPNPAGYDLQTLLLGRWTEINPSEALNWATATLDGRSRGYFLNSMAGVWAKHDLSDAIAWAQQLPQSAEQQNILARIADEATYIDPVMALTLASTLPENSSLDALIANAAGQWADKSPEAAVAWAGQIPDENLKAKVTSAIAIEWANSNPAAAADLAIDSLPAGLLQNLTIIDIVRRLALTDMATATSWVSQFPKGDLREGAQESLREASEQLKLSEALSRGATSPQ
jgi:hypothetical protein